MTEHPLTEHPLTEHPLTEHPLLRTDTLCKSFDHKGQTIEVLRDLNFTLQARERVAVIGTSGVGKSTLLHLLGALDQPTSGEIYLEGAPLSELTPSELARFRNEHVGFIFQFHHLLKEFTALENVMMPALIARQSRSEATEKAEWWLDQVGLAHRMKHRPSEMSGGEQQRVSLARALINSPKILLADEPTGNLDEQTSAEIHNLLNQVNEEHGTALLIVTHSPELARMMPRQLRMLNGHLSERSS
jgi:lipoprotein-releasing system ATP-binding protein